MLIEIKENKVYIRNIALVTSGPYRCHVSNQCPQTTRIKADCALSSFLSLLPSHTMAAPVGLRQHPSLIIQR